MTYYAKSVRLVSASMISQSSFADITGPGASIGADGLLIAGGFEDQIAAMMPPIK
jgi:hypothetical protein